MSNTNDSMKSYRAIALDLINKIAAGDLKEGSFLPLERQLIEQYGVTRTTVRRALAELVEQGHGRLVPNRGVVALKKRPAGTKAFGFVAGSSIVLRGLYAHLNSTLVNMGYYLVHIDSQTIGLENALLFAQEHGFLGAFIWSFEGYPDVDFLGQIQKKMAIVALDHKLGDFNSDIVTFDYADMACKAVVHLMKMGRKRVAVTGMLDMLDTTHQRFSGYMRGVFEGGGTPDVRDYVFCFTSGYRPANFDALAQRLKADDRPDALFVMQDELVPGVVDTALKCGLSVPGDLVIATIGDDVIVNVEGQGIASVHCDWQGFATDAMNLLLKRIREPEGARVRILANHELVPGHAAGSLARNTHSEAYVVTRLRRSTRSNRPVNL